MTRCIVLAFALACLSACETESRPVGPSRVRPATPETTIVGLQRVLAGEEHVAWLKTYRYEDTERTITRVIDLKDRAVGYVTPDGKAYRYTAHEGHELVANSTDLRRNVAAVLGRPLEDLTLVDEVSGR